MEELTILAKNESGEEPFKVDFINDAGRLKITCNCPDGRKGLLCDHKARFAANDFLLLEHPGSRGRLLEAHVWVVESELANPLLELIQMAGKGETETTEYWELQEKLGHMMKEGCRLEK